MTILAGIAWFLLSIVGILVAVEGFCFDQPYNIVSLAGVSMVLFAMTGLTLGCCGGGGA